MKSNLLVLWYCVITNNTCNNVKQENVMPIIIIKKEIVGRFFSSTQNNIMESYTCKKCGKEYGAWWWCKPCQIDNLKGNFTNWTSGNEKIDNFIQEMQLKID